MYIPAVSIIMSVYNGERHIVEAIESIRTQSFASFEFIIVDDASTDSTPEILRRYASKDNRITILTNATNKERSISRNRAIEQARSELIAVMDADDVAMPYRLEKQITFMQANTDVTVCGGKLSIYDAPTEIWLPPTKHEAIRAKLLFESSILHPTAIYRKEPVSLHAGGYDTSLSLAEDYDLWARLSIHPAVRFANLPEILCKYRVSHQDKKYKERLQLYANIVRKKLLCSIGLTPTDKEFAAHLALSLCSRTLSFSEVWDCKKWLSKLYVAALTAESAYEREALRHELQYRWLELCKNNIVASVFGLMYLCSEFRIFSIKLLLKFAKLIIKNIHKTLCK